MALVFGPAIYTETAFSLFDWSRLFSTSSIFRPIHYNLLIEPTARYFGSHRVQSPNRFSSSRLAFNHDVESGHDNITTNNNNNSGGKHDTFVCTVYTVCVGVGVGVDLDLSIFV